MSANGAGKKLMEIWLMHSSRSYPRWNVVEQFRYVFLFCIQKKWRRRRQQRWHFDVNFFSSFLFPLLPPPPPPHHHHHFCWHGNATSWCSLFYKCWILSAYCLLDCACVCGISRFPLLSMLLLLLCLFSTSLLFSILLQIHIIIFLHTAQHSTHTHILIFFVFATFLFCSFLLNFVFVVSFRCCFTFLFRVKKRDCKGSVDGGMGWVRFGKFLHIKRKFFSLCCFWYYCIVPHLSWLRPT